MSIDVDAWRRATGVWTVTLDGFTFRARPVSARAVAEAVPLLADRDRHHEAFRALMRLAFPWRVSYGWTGDPVKKIMALEPAVYREVRDDFFDYLGASGARSAPETAGTTSPPRTPSQSTSGSAGVA